MDFVLGILAFYGCILLSIVAVVVNAVDLCRAKKKNKLTPGAVSEEQIRDYKTALISFAAIACVLLAVVIGVASLLDTAVAYM